MEVTSWESNQHEFDRRHEELQQKLLALAPLNPQLSSSHPENQIDIINHTKIVCKLIFHASQKKSVDSSTTR